jgi:hypothetical protein
MTQLAVGLRRRFVHSRWESFRRWDRNVWRNRLSPWHGGRALDTMEHTRRRSLRESQLRTDTRRGRCPLESVSDQTANVLTDRNSQVGSTVAFSFPIHPALVIPTTHAPPPKANSTTNPHRLVRDTLSFHTRGSGRTRIATSVRTFKMLVTRANWPMLMQWPPSIVRSQLYAKGVHWKLMVRTVVSIQAPIKTATPRSIRKKHAWGKIRL